MDQNIIKMLQDYKLKFSKENMSWNPDEDEDHNSFYTNLKKLINKLWEVNDKYRKGKEEIVKVPSETKKFMKHMKMLRNDKVCLGNYMATFYKMIKFAEMDCDDVVTSKSIDKGINDNPQYTFFILLSCEITFTEVWVFVEDDKDRDRLASIINRMFFYSRRFVLLNKIDIKKYKVPCVEYKTKIQGRFNVLKMFTHDSISESKDIDDKEKGNTRKNTDQILDGLIQCFVKNKIDDERDLLDFESIPFNQDVLNAITDVENYFKKNKGNYSKKDIALSCISFIDLCKKFPEEVKANSELKAIINMFIILIEEKMKYGGSTTEGKKVFKKLKEIFYDPSFKMDSGTEVLMKSLVNGEKEGGISLGGLNRKLRRRMKKKLAKKKKKKE